MNKKSLLHLLSLLWLNPVLAAAEPTEVELHRLRGNPIIRPEMLPGSDGGNINGPSLIRVPSWVDAPLGRYYLYFAHHGGEYIRLAYADHLEGPWKIHEPGVLHLKNTPACKGHIASPDVIVDESRREIRMYFHGPARAVSGQKSFVATGKDGLHFSPSDEVLGTFYFRVFPYENAWYALAKGGVVHRSADGLTGFERGRNPFPGGESRTGDLNEPGPRHLALHRQGETLWVYYSSIGDAPERILRAPIKLHADWREWRAEDPEEVLRPEFPWEGADLPVKRSTAGAAKVPLNELRDPAIFEDDDGRTYLLYSVAGESGIAIAELIQPKS